MCEHNYGSLDCLFRPLPTDLHVGLILDQLLCSSVQEPDVRVSLGHGLKTGCYGHRTWSMFNTASNEFSQFYQLRRITEGLLLLKRAFTLMSLLRHYAKQALTHGK